MSRKVLITIIAIVVAVLAVLASVLLIIWGQNKEERYITRAEWIAMLGENFCLTTYSQEEPYFSDVKQEHAAFPYVQSCYEWGILRNGTKLKPEKTATQEFVAETAVLAAMLDYDATFAEKSSAELLQYASSEGIVTSSKSKEKMTEQDCLAVIEAIRAHYLSLEYDEYANVALKENVVDLSNHEDIVETDTAVILPAELGEDISVGTIFIVPGYPYGTAKKAVSVTAEDGQTVVETVEPELEEVFDSLEFRFSGSPEYQDIIPLQEGITILPYTETTPVNCTEGYKVVPLSNVTALKAGTKKDPLSFEVSVDFVQGKLTPNIAFNEFFEVEAEGQFEELFHTKLPKDAGKVFENTNQILKKDKNGNIKLDTVERWTEGFELTGTLKMSDLYIDVAYTDNLKTFESKVHFEVESSLTYKGTINGEVPIYEAVIPGPWGVWVKVVFYVYVDANGTISVGTTMEHTTSVTYKAKKFKNVQTTDFDAYIDLGANIASGVKLAVVPTALGIELIDLSAKAGAGLDLKTTLHQSPDNAMACLSGELYFPVVSVSVGVDSGTLANKLGVKGTFKLVDKSGGLVKSAKTTLWHMEVSADGVSNVKKCTWGNNSGSHSSGGNGNNATIPGFAPDNTTSSNRPPEAPTTPTISVPTVPTGPYPEASEGLDIVVEGDYCVVYGIGSCVDTDIVIPAYYNGIPVAGINSNAFSDCTSLTSITIPDSVTSIGVYAFKGCASLTSITIPDSVTSIGDQAFQNCTGLQSIIIPNSVTSIGAQAFGNCTNLTSITIPDSVTRICDYTFVDCASLTRVTFGENSQLESIGYNAFRFCTSLLSVTIPNGVTSIDSWAFNGCTSLTSITIPDTVTSIGSLAFTDTAYCNDESNWVDGVLYINNHLIRAAADISFCAIKSGTLTLAEDAFAGCHSLESVTIPDSVTSICASAFYFCVSLENITIPDSVTSIGYRAFWYCRSLAGITIGDGVTSIGDYAFKETAYIYNENNWVDGVLYINNHLIDAVDISSCVIKSGTLTIADNAFSGCWSLESIVIPDSVRSIGVWAFEDCVSLTSIFIPDGVTSIGERAFEGCASLSSIIIPKGVTNIGGFTFTGCASLSSITIPDSVTSIGNFAFADCMSLTSIIIPDSVTSIGMDVFHDCRGLDSIVFVGTIAEWNAITKGIYWDFNVPATEVVCSDGVVSLY